MIRITADLDNTPLIIAKKRTIAILVYLYKNYKIHFEDKIIRKSSSGKGCHVILWTNHKLKEKEVIFIRMLLGDDFQRIIRDSKNPKQHLFYKKRFLNDKDREELLIKLRGKK